MPDTEVGLLGVAVAAGDLQRRAVGECHRLWPPAEQRHGQGNDLWYARDVVASNVYFELTDAFNSQQLVAVLGSGQAVVHYRLAIMSKDGDWIIREDDEACRIVLSVLSSKGAWYRPGAPLDPRWLSGGWSSHLEHRDERGRRVRCDFFSRPPRIPEQAVAALFCDRTTPRQRPVIGLEELILMKRTQRAKDYPIIGELARRLPPEREIELTTDPDRVLELAASAGAGSQRPAVLAARHGRGRRAVVLAIAEETDEAQQRDRQRLLLYQETATRYLECFKHLSRDQLCLPDSQGLLLRLAAEHLDMHPLAGIHAAAL